MIEVFGKLKLGLRVGGQWFRWSCVVANIEEDGILGMDLLSRLSLRMDGETRRLFFHPQSSTIHCIEQEIIMPDELTEQQRVHIRSILNRWKAVFGKPEFVPGKAVSVEHRIETADSPPIKRGPYRVPHIKQQ